MNKKGFTLIEIIISLTLIILIAGSITFAVLNNKNKKEEKINEITRKIQEAASVYLSINKEIDDSIEKNIYNGGSGYVIPFKTLINEGYISEDYITTLESNGQKISNDAYMLAALFSGDTTMCDNTQGVISIEPNYDPEHNTEPYYLCNFTTEKTYVYYDLDGGNFKDGTEQVQLYNKNSKVTIESGTKVKKARDDSYEYSFVGWYDDKDFTIPTRVDGENKFELTSNKVIYAKYQKTPIERKLTINELLKNASTTNNFTKSAVSQEWCDNHPGYDSDKIVCNENGIFIDQNKTNNIMYYYYRGAVENNYVNLAGKLWRILWVNSNKKAKLILDDSINLKVKNLDGNFVELGKDSTILNINIADIKNRPTDTSIFDSSYKISRNYSIVQRNDQTKTILGSFLDCSNSNVDCTDTSGNLYNFRGEYLYENLNKTNYVHHDVTGWNADNISSLSPYNTTINEISDLLAKDSTFDEIVPNNTWYYYNNDYDNYKSIYYKKNGWSCNWNASYCLNLNFPTSYDIDANSYNKINYNTGKIGFINYHELRMAGLTTTKVENSDNFLVKDNNSNFIIAEYYFNKNSDINTLEWYYVNGTNANISNFKILEHLSDGIPNILVRSYDQHKTLDSCDTYKYGKCTSSGHNDGTLLLGGHASDYINLYNYSANTIRPVIEINLDKYTFSDTEGTKSNPYLLVK